MKSIEHLWISRFWKLMGYNLAFSSSFDPISTMLNNFLTVPKHFPFSKFICWQENGRRWQASYGTRMGKKGDLDSCLSASFTILNSNIYETRLYFEFTTTNCKFGKNLWTEIFEPKVGNLGHFYNFFSAFVALLEKVTS